ncbi:hypothetical protein VPNG_07046 [Cytospora leucostoma]|uniref:Uncharacterized protein n=1 Tax=Cytospora leucostoma TaxID=1230097 RepID=A0A423WNC9_9PEZI|nr:hypothetical protein VPNG_07046 [Cytospora leucostoma]
MKGYPLFYLALGLAKFDMVLPHNLNVTVIGANNGKSRFECWELDAPFMSSTQSGVVGTETTTLGDVANITYNVIPANFDSGLHNAPYSQWAIVLQGKAVLTLPDNTSTKVVLVPGSLVFFSDTTEVSDKGHGCYYPGATRSVFLQIPAKDGKAPGHHVVSADAPCPGVRGEDRSW